MCIKLQLIIYCHPQELYLIFTQNFIPIQIKFISPFFYLFPMEIAWYLSGLAFILLLANQSIKIALSFSRDLTNPLKFGPQCDNVLSSA